MPGGLILIVEDEADTATLIEFHLLRAGFCPMRVADGVAAMNFVFEHRPVLLILDRMLPGIPGLEVCRLIKSSPVIRDTRILMLTAMASMQNKLEGFEQGVDDYLTKPFNVRELIARVRKLLDRP